MSFRKSSSNRNGSKSDVLPKPKARRRCTPAPSSVGLDLISRLIGRRDIASSLSSGIHFPPKQVGFRVCGLGLPRSRLAPKPSLSKCRDSGHFERRFLPHFLSSNRNPEGNEKTAQGSASESATL